MISEAIRRDWGIALSHRMPFLFDVLAVLAGAALFYYLGRFTTGAGDEFFAFAVAGISVLRLNGALPRVVQQTTHSIASGNLELLYSERPEPQVVVAESAFELLRGLGTAVLAILVAALVFGAPIETSPEALAAVAVGLGAATLLFGVVALGVIAILMIFREAGALATLSSLAVPVLGAAYFPVSTLPEPLETIADLLPFSGVVEIVRSGILEGELELATCGEVLVGIGVLGAAATALLLWSVGRVRRTGTLASL
jgi:ABC-2 type transport system permease protein